jgi:hypothetical protein
MKSSATNLLTFSLTMLVGLSLSVCWKTYQEGVEWKARATTEILTITNRLNEALIQQDVRVLRSLASDDLVWSEGGPDMLNWNRSEWLAAIESGSFKFKFINVENSKVEITGTEATITGQVVDAVSFSTDKHRSEITFKYPIRYCFKLKEGRWRLVSTRFDGAI